MLRDLAAASNTQNEYLRVLTEKMHKDARSVRVLTFVALIYLPSSLLAVSPNFTYYRRVLTERTEFSPSSQRTSFRSLASGNKNIAGPYL